MKTRFFSVVSNSITKGGGKIQLFTPEQYMAYCKTYLISGPSIN